MSIPSFALGFFSALGVVAFFVFGLYRHLTLTKWKQSSVKGYLDLIPDLTREQKEQVRRIRSTFLPRVEGIRQNLYAKRSELAGALFADPTDRSRIYPLADEILKYQAELEHEVIEHIIEEKEMLFPSQRVKFYNIIMEQFASGGLGVHDVKGRRG